MPIALLLLTAGVVRAQCADTAADLRTQVGLVLDAYVNMDEPGYERANQSMHQAVDCLTELPDPALVRDVHLVTALDRFLNGQRDDALGGLRAVLDLDSGYQLPEEIAPPGHPLRALLEQARAQPPHSRRRFLRPIEGVFYLDTQPMAERPQGQPAFVQWADIDHAICWTGYLDPEEALPPAILAAATEPGALARCVAERAHSALEPQVAEVAPPAVVEEPPPVSTEPSPPPPSPVVRLAEAPPLEPAPAALPPPVATLAPERSLLLRPLPIATAGGVAVSSGLLVAALFSRHALLVESERCAVQGTCDDDSAAALERIDALENRTRGLGYATQVSAGLTTGLGVAAGISLAF